QEAAVARSIEAWATKQMPRFSFGTGKVDGSFIPVLDYNGHPHYPIALYTRGSIEIQFMFLKSPPFDDLDLRRELLRRLNDGPGVAFPDDAITRRPSIAMEALCEHATLDRFLAVFDWFCETVRSAS